MASCSPVLSVWYVSECEYLTIVASNSQKQTLESETKTMLKTKHRQQTNIQLEIVGMNILKKIP